MEKQMNKEAAKLATLQKDERDGWLLAIRVASRIIAALRDESPQELRGLPAYSRGCRRVPGGKKRVRDILLEAGVELSGGGRHSPLMARLKGSNKKQQGACDEDFCVASYI
jgi:hypothetical protein